MEEIYKKVKMNQATFTKGFIKVAELVYKNPQIIAMKSAVEVGNEIGVSETTVIRFSNNLGYSGYRDLQQDIRNKLFSRSSLSGYLDLKMEEQEDDNIFKSIMKNDINNILKLMKQISEEDLQRAVSKLSNAEQVLVTGVRSSHALASWFAFTLDLVVGNSRLYHSNVDDILLRMSELSKEESVLVVFSFHRYAKETLNIAKLAQKLKVFVIAFTDSPLSPITEYSNLVLNVQLNVKSTLDSAPVVFSLINSIISTISIENPEKFKKRAEMFDAMDTEDLFPVFGRSIGK